MELNIEEGEVNVIADRILRMEMDCVIAYRYELFELFNGDVFYPLDSWPQSMRTTF